MIICWWLIQFLEVYPERVPIITKDSRYIMGSNRHKWFFKILKIPHLDYSISFRWRHNERDGVSNHQPHDCLLNGLFRRRSKKTSKLRVTGLCVGNSLGPVNSPHKGPVTRKMFPFDDVIMLMKMSGPILPTDSSSQSREWKSNCV